MTENQKNEFEDLRLQLAVHITSLHQDAEGQATLAFRAGQLAADLKLASRKARLEQDAAEAAADADVRGNPGNFGLDKITETAVKNAVVLHPAAAMSREITIAADHDADQAQALSNAYEHRRAMLKAEVDLYLGNYWGDPETRDREMRRVATPAEAKATTEKESEVEQRRAELKRRRLAVPPNPDDNK